VSTAAARPQVAPATAPPLLDRRAVLFGCGALLAGYAVLFAAGWLHGGTLFGHRDTANYDFSVLWGAGRLALAGKATAAYDWHAVSELLNGALGRPAQPGYPAFFYPPVLLLVLAPLALLPYPAAAALWVGATLAAYLATIRRVLSGGTAIVAALAAPAVFFNLVTGQNGLLTAGLIGGALSVLDEHPLLAGALAGLLVYKPQFAVMLPLFLAVTRRWRSLAAAGVTVLVLLTATAACFGPGVFADFATALPNANDAFLNHRLSAGMLPLPWERLASIYGTLRALGAGAAVAWTAQCAVALPAAAAALWLAARPAPDAVKSAAVAIAAFVVTPYSLAYDLAVLTVPTAFLIADGIARGLRRWEIAALAAAFVMPLLLLSGTGSQIGSGPAMCALLALVVAGRQNAAGGLGRR
jgi:alpha-1,2-mannosyltransferase